VSFVGNRPSCRHRCGPDQRDDKIADARGSQYLVAFLNVRCGWCRTCVGRAATRVKPAEQELGESSWGALCGPLVGVAQPSGTSVERGGIASSAARVESSRVIVPAATLDSR